MAFKVEDAVITIGFAELAENPASPEETYGPEGLTAVRTLRCDWASRHKLARQLIGRVDSKKGIIYRGHKYPYADSVYATNVEIISIGPTSTTSVLSSKAVMTYDEALLRVTYTPEQTDNKLRTKVSVRTSTEIKTLTSARLYWDAAKSEALEENAGIPIMLTDIIVTRQGIENLPPIFSSASGYLPGSINKDDIEFEGIPGNFAKETVMLVDSQADNYINSEGDEVWDLVLNFQARPYSWNKFYRDSHIPQEVFTEVSGPGAPVIFDPFPLEDLNSLLES